MQQTLLPRPPDDENRGGPYNTPISSPFGSTVTVEGKGFKGPMERLKLYGQRASAPPDKRPGRQQTSLQRVPGTIKGGHLGGAQTFMVIGPKGVTDVYDELSDFQRLDPEGFARARRWYEDLADVFDRFGEERGKRLLVAFLASQQNTTTTQGMINVLAVGERIQGAIKQGGTGMADERIQSILQLAMDDAHLGAKLHDFVDSALGKKYRTYMGEQPGGRSPAAIDRWSFRFSGFLDDVFKDLVAEFADGPVDFGKVDQKGDGAPSDTQYDIGIDLHNDAADFLNERGFDGGGWTAAQVQAAGWAWTMVRSGDRLDSPLDLFASVNKYLAVEVVPGENAPASVKKEWDRLEKTYGKDALPFQMAVSHDVLSFAIPRILELFGGVQADLTSSVGGYMSSVNASGGVDLTATQKLAEAVAALLGWALHQDAVWITHPTARGLEKTGSYGPTDAISIIITDKNLGMYSMRSDLFDAINEEFPYMAGFSPVDHNGQPGIQILIPRGQGRSKWAIEQNALVTRTAQDLYRDGESAILSKLKEVLRKKFHPKGSIHVSRVDLTQVESGAGGRDYRDRIERLTNRRATQRDAYRLSKEIQARWREAIDLAVKQRLPQFAERQVTERLRPGEVVKPRRKKGPPPEYAHIFREDLVPAIKRPDDQVFTGIHHGVAALAAGLRTALRMPPGWQDGFVGKDVFFTRNEADEYWQVRTAEELNASGVRPKTTGPKGYVPLGPVKLMKPPPLKGGSVGGPKPPRTIRDKALTPRRTAVVKTARLDGLKFRRPVAPDAAARMVKSIERMGIRTPITVKLIDGEWWVTKGGAQLVAARQLKLAQVPLRVLNEKGRPLENHERPLPLQGREFPAAALKGVQVRRKPKTKLPTEEDVGRGTEYLMDVVQDEMAREMHAPFEVDVDDLFPGGTKGIINRLNLDKFDTPEDIRGTLAELANVSAKAIDRARRGGPRDHKALMERVRGKLANHLGQTVKQLLDRRVGETFNDETQVAGFIILEWAARKARSAAQAAMATQKPEHVAEMEAATALSQALQANVMGSSTELGRALGAHRIVRKQLEDLRGDVMGAEAILNEITSQGLPKAMELAKALTALKGPESNQAASRTIATYDQPTIFRAWTEQMKSGLLFWKTWLVNAGSNALMLGFDPIDRALVSMYSKPRTYFSPKMETSVTREDGFELEEAYAKLWAFMQTAREAIHFAGDIFFEREGQGRFPQYSAVIRGGMGEKTDRGPRPQFVAEAFGIGRREGSVMKRLGLTVEAPRRRSFDAQGNVIDPGRAPRVAAAIDYFGKFIRKFGFDPLDANDAATKAMSMSGETAAIAMREAVRARKAGEMTREEMWDHIDERMIQPTDEMLVEGFETAKENTLTNDLGPIAQRLSDALQGIPVLQWLIPFLKVPINGPSWAIRRMPVGPISRRLRADWEAGGRRRVQAEARVMYGSMIATFFALLGAAGILTDDGPREKGARAPWLLKNQPRSLRVKSRWLNNLSRELWGTLGLPVREEPDGDTIQIGLGRFEPFSSLAFTPVTLMNSYGEGDELPKGWADRYLDQVLGVVGAFAENSLNQSFFTGVSQFVRAIDNVESNQFNYWASQMAGNAMPFSAAGRQINSLIYGKSRIIRGIGGRLQSQTLSGGLKIGDHTLLKPLPTVYDIIGREVAAYGGLGVKLLQIPVGWTPETTDRVALDLYELTKDGFLSIQSPSEFVQILKQKDGAPAGEYTKVRVQLDPDLISWLQENIGLGFRATIDARWDELHDPKKYNQTTRALEYKRIRAEVSEDLRAQAKARMEKRLTERGQVGPPQRY
ncbi:MAG: ParB N-terminal domain-containing protein [Planctomycetota bacterium]